MPVLLLATLALLIAICFWIWRARQVAKAAREVSGAAGDIRLAFRRLGFKRDAQTDPLDSVEDPRLAASGVIVAIARMDGDLTQAEHQALVVESQIAFEINQAEAMDIAAFGRWIVNQSETPEEAASRLVKVVRSKTQPDAWPQLISMITNVATADGGELDERQEEALGSVSEVLKI